MINDGSDVTLMIPYGTSDEKNYVTKKSKQASSKSRDSCVPEPVPAPAAICTKMGVACAVVGCPNSVATLRRWKKAKCEKHEDKIHSTCGCPQPYKFHIFPLRKPDLLRRWLAKINRKNFVPTKSSHICSVHFIDGIYNSGFNNCPQLHLGYKSKVDKPRRGPVMHLVKYIPRPQPPPRKPRCKPTPFEIIPYEETEISQMQVVSDDSDDETESAPVEHSYCLLDTTFEIAPDLFPAPKIPDRAPVEHSYCSTDTTSELAPDLSPAPKSTDIVVAEIKLHIEGLQSSTIKQAIIDLISEAMSKETISKLDETSPNTSSITILKSDLVANGSTKVSLKSPSLDCEVLNSPTTAVEIAPESTHKTSTPIKSNIVQQDFQPDALPEAASLEENVESLGVQLDIVDCKQNLTDNKKRREKYKYIRCYSEMSTERLDDRLLKFYTALSKESFFLLADGLKQVTVKKKRNIEHNEQILLVLMRLRLNLFFEDLGFRFGISRTTAEQLFRFWSPKITEYRSKLLEDQMKQASEPELPELLPIPREEIVEGSL